METTCLGPAPDLSVVALDPFVKPSDVGRVGDVTLHADRPVADIVHGLGE